MTYKEAEKKAKGYVAIYQATKSQMGIINGIEQEVQRYTFQSLVKKTRNIKLSRSNKVKKYKGKKITKQIVSDVDAKATQEEIKTKPKKKPFGEIEKEMQEIFEQIGQEFQEKIGGNDYERK